MAVETQYGIRGLAKLQEFPPGLAFAGNHGGRVRHVTDRVAAFSNGASIASLFYMARIPSAAVMLPLSMVYWGACGSSVTLNIGDATDDDAIATVIDVASAGSALIMEASGKTPLAAAGQRLWELLGYTADPKRDIDLIGKIAGAAISTATGAFAWSLLYSND